MKNLFSVNVEKYSQDQHFIVQKAASISKPQNNAVMFIIEKNIEYATVFENIEKCLIFWPKSVSIPKTLLERHVVIASENPHNDYCRFFRDNTITNLPAKEDGVFIDGAWIATNAVIGENVIVMPGAYISGDCVIGNSTYIGSGVKLVGEVEIGNNVVIRENSVIGADGLTTDRDSDGRAITMPQFGCVVIEDNVQIGANSVIARGAIDETRICRGSKIDNSCFISHNVFVGEDSYIVGESILFGSSSTGNQSMISGNSTIRNGIHIGNRALVGMGSVVVKSVADDAVVKGNPAR